MYVLWCSLYRLFSQSPIFVSTSISFSDVHDSVHLSHCFCSFLYFLNYFSIFLCFVWYKKYLLPPTSCYKLDVGICVCKSIPRRAIRIDFTFLETSSKSVENTTGYYGNSFSWNGSRKFEEVCPCLIMD